MRRVLLAATALAGFASPALAQQHMVAEPRGIGGPAITPVPLAVPTPPPPPVTVITPDTGTLGLGTTTSRNGTVTTIDGGTRAGTNLYHSFTRFDLANGEVARWIRSAGDGADIRFVINRVTGGDPSDIAGGLNTTALPNADFFFINPAGIFFSQGARINVSGSAHFSTGAELRFASGPAFTIATPGGSTLSVAAPASFGFVGTQGPIGVSDANFNFLVNRGALTMAGSDIRVTNSNIVGNGLRFVAFGSGSGAFDLGTAEPAATAGALNFDNVTLRQLTTDMTRPRGIVLVGGTVEVNSSDLGTAFSATDPNRGIAGPVTIIGNTIHLFSDYISASTFGGEPASDIRILGGTILIDGQTIVATETRQGSTGAPGSLLLAGSSITILDRSRVSASTQTATPGGNLRLQADTIRLDRSSVVAEALPTASGRAGLIEIAGRTLDLANGASITSSTYNQGDAGGVEIQVTERVTLARSTIESSALGGTGDAGMVRIRTGAVQLTDQSRIQSETFGLGDAGIVDISATGAITLDGRSVLSSRSALGSTGAAGILFVDADTLTLTDQSTIQSDTNSPGEGGGIFVNVRDLRVAGGSEISSDSGPDCPGTCGPVGNAGGVAINAATVRLDNGSISSFAAGNGNAGVVQITARQLLDVRHSSSISTSTNNDGNAGAIGIIGGAVTVSGSRITSGTSGTGLGGSITISGSSLALLDDSAILARTLFEDGGDGGSVTIDAPTVTLDDDSEINTVSMGRGLAGSITVTGRNLTLTNGSSIVGFALGRGRGGDILLTVDNILVRDSFVIASADSLEQGAGGAGSITINARTLTVEGSAPLEGGGRRNAELSTSTAGVAPAGRIAITADDIRLRYGTITSTTDGFGTAPAGQIDIVTGSLTLTDLSLISTGAGSPCFTCGIDFSGNAGRVSIMALGLVSLTGDSAIRSDVLAGDGAAGQVDIQAASLFLRGGQIATTNQGTGPSGAVNIMAGTVELQGPDDATGSIITTSSFNALPGGAITVTADRLSLIGGGAAIIALNNSQRVPGDAGSILIEAGNVDLINGAALNSSSVLGAAGSISILMPSTGFLTLDSRFEPSLITTSSGPGTGGRIIIASPFAIISNGGIILALGEEGGANVAITTRYFITSSDRTNQVSVDGNFLLEAQAYDVSMGTVARDLSVIDASGVLRGQCAAARSTGQVSQLVVRPVGPYGRALGVGSIAPGSCI